MKLAVIKTGGKQYLVEEGREIEIEKIREKKGQIIFSDLLLITDKRKVVVDPKKLQKAKVEAEIIEIKKGPKIKIIKQKPKKGYLRRMGHRQPYLKVKIKKIKA